MGPRAETEPFTARFGRVWPEVEQPLRRYLASRALAGHEIDDVVQEVAARALDRQVPFADAGELRAWCFVVARRIRVDQVRLAGRSVELGAASGVADRSQHRALDQVEDRHLLSTVRAAVGQLADHERAALASADPLASRGERNRAAVARHRARRRLKQLVGPFAVLPWLGRRRPARLRLGAMTSVAVPGALAAIVMTQGLVPFATGPAAGSPRTHLAVMSTAPAAGEFAQRSAHPLTRALSHALSRSALGRRQVTHTVAVVSAPNHTQVSVATAPNDHRRPLLCTDGTVVQRLCVGLPHPLSWSSVPTVDAARLG